MPTLIVLDHRLHVAKTSLKEGFPSAIRPVRRPLAVALDDIDKLASDDTVGLLAWVQLVVPHERIGISGVSGAI